MTQAQLRRESPLVDTLFRPTVASAAATSAAPVRAAGVHSRAGNAMNRTRAALLAGAARAVETSGTRFAMAQVATASGVAKATLYNHFRTREAVLAALLVRQVRAIVDDQQGKRLDAALADAALAVSANPVRRALARLEPAALAALARIDPAADGWQVADAAVRAALAAHGKLADGSGIVLRWLASFVTTEGTPVAIATDVRILVAALPDLDAALR